MNCNWIACAFFRSSKSPPSSSKRSFLKNCHQKNWGTKSVTHACDQNTTLAETMLSLRRDVCWNSVNLGWAVIIANHEHERGTKRRSVERWQPLMFVLGHPEVTTWPPPPSVLTPVSRYHLSVVKAYRLEPDLTLTQTRTLSHTSLNMWTD